MLGHADPTISTTVQAEPLAKLLAAIDPPRTTDSWSLDIEGSECDVLRATDFQKITVAVFLIEMNKSEKNNACIESVMKSNGFQDLGRLDSDKVFVNRAYFQERYLLIPELVNGAKNASNIAVPTESAIHLDPPSQEPYHFAQPMTDMHRSQFGQDKALEPLLSQIKNGFFVESGAHDGEAISNTVYYESLGWQGLLIEPSNHYASILRKHRKAWAFNGALSPSGKSQQLNFRHGGVLGHADPTISTTVQAEPLAKLLSGHRPNTNHRLLVS